jgi:hypothetical protein
MHRDAGYDDADEPLCGDIYDWDVQPLDDGTIVEIFYTGAEYPKTEAEFQCDLHGFDQLNWTVTENIQRVLRARFNLVR